MGGLVGLPRTGSAEAVGKSRVLLMRNKDVVDASGSVRAEVIEVVKVGWDEGLLI